MNTLEIIGCVAIAWCVWRAWRNVWRLWRFLNSERDDGYSGRFGKEEDNPRLD